MSLAHLLVILTVYESVICGRDFAVDYEANTFVKDGVPFRFVSGSLNYFNVPHELWEQRLRAMRLGGINVLQTGIEWRSHEPQSGNHSFNGQNDVVQFIQLAQQIGFMVNLQIGPFIDSSRDMGGLPWWLLSSERSIGLRSSDPQFLTLVDRWFSVLLPKLKPLLYRSGGPIILVQLENQYGSSGGCDRNYTEHLFRTASQLLGNETVFVTADAPNDSALKCGGIDGCLATVSFGPTVDPAEAVQALLRCQPRGPLVNSAFSTATPDEWGHAHHTSNETTYATRLDELLSLNMSVNIAMFHGGSQWYFDSGAKLENGTFTPFTTSFDMDAPLNEAGDPTPKFFALKNVLKKWFPDVPEKNPDVGLKMSLTPIKAPLMFDFDFLITRMEAAGLFKTLQSIDSMESVGFDYGLVVYSTLISSTADGAAVVSINNVRDRGYVYLNGELQSVIDRSQNAAEVTLHLTNNSRLDILVENQGRASDDVMMHDRKGLISNVTIENTALGPWKIFQLARSRADMQRANEAGVNIKGLKEAEPHQNSTEGLSLHGNFFLLKGAPRDTYLKLNGFTKGYVWLNGNHLGR